MSFIGQKREMMSFIQQQHETWKGLRTPYHQYKHNDVLYRTIIGDTERSLDSLQSLLGLRCPSRKSGKDPGIPDITTAVGPRCPM